MPNKQARRWLYLTVLLLAGCPQARTPLPGGPPPVYEEPRGYTPQRNIDEPDHEPDDIDKLLDQPDPEPAGASTSSAIVEPAPVGGASP